MDWRKKVYWTVDKLKLINAICIAAENREIEAIKLIHFVTNSSSDKIFNEKIRFNVFLSDEEMKEIFDH